MPQHKGKTGNPNGRPKGSKNKSAGNLRLLITEFLEEKFKEVEKEWKNLEAKDKLSFYKDLLKYAVPALQATPLTSDFEKLTDHQVDEIIERLITIQNNKQHELT